MTLRVFTSRMGIRDPDYLDITVQGNLKRMEAGEHLGHRGMGSVFAPEPAKFYAMLSKRRSGSLGDVDWIMYRGDYIRYMRVSYRKYREQWSALLGLERVVLLCFCKDAERCHRTVLAKDVLVKLGCQYVGEIV